MKIKIDESFFIGEYRRIPRIMRKVIIDHVNGDKNDNFIEALSRNDLYDTIRYSNQVNFELIKVYANLFNELRSLSNNNS